MFIAYNYLMCGTFRNKTLKYRSALQTLFSNSFEFNLNSFHRFVQLKQTNKHYT